MIYLDNAATTYPKPRCVVSEALHCIKSCGGNPGRSGHRLSRAASEEVYSCREQIAWLFGGKEENVVFTFNATYALNIAINALADPKKCIVISNMEHNAVRRPALAHTGGCRMFDVTGADMCRQCRYGVYNEDAVIRSLDRAVGNDTGLVVCNHVSNLCGLTAPVTAIGRYCRMRGIPFVIDASQSAGVIPINISECCADAICVAGHKGLYGLQGAGFVIWADKYSGDASVLREYAMGGSGALSLERSMPTFLPERFEAGTVATPAIASLAAGIRFVRKMGIDTIRQHEFSVADRFRRGLMSMRGVTVYGDIYGGGTVLFNINGMSSEDVSEKLDQKGIAVRGGYHCCPLGHQLLGTLDREGAVRASFSIFNRPQEADAALRAVDEIVLQ